MKNAIASINGSSSDELFKKMASPTEGWSIKNEGISKDVPLNAIDYFATQLLSNTVSDKTKTVLTSPRIMPGTALGLAAYITMNRFLGNRFVGMEKLNLIFKGYQFVDIDETLPIVIITKRRQLRDYFLRSELKFGYHSFEFSKTFPLLRINREGNCVPLIDATDLDQVNTPPIVFYHFDHLEHIPENLKGAIVIIELDEPINYGTWTRMISFLDGIVPVTVFAIANIFAKNQLEQFKSFGFGIVSLVPNLLSDYSTGISEEMPSFASSLSNVPEMVSVSLADVKANDVDQYINRIAKTLIDISKSAKGDLPHVYYAARNIFSILKNIAVPMELYEDARRAHPQYKTLKFNLTKIFTSQYLDMNENHAALIQPIWDSLASDFLDLYNKITSQNKKYDELVAYITSEDFDNKTIVLADALQVDILKGILADHHSKLDIEITCFKNMDRIDYVDNNLLLTGTWKGYDEVALFSSLPRSITVLIYMSEMFGIQNSIKRVNDFHNVDTKNHLKIMGSSRAYLDEEDSQWIVLDNSSTELIAQGLPQTQTPANDHINLDDLFIEMIEDEELNTTEDIEPLRDLVTGYLINLSNGENGYLLPNKEVLVYADKKSVIGPVTPEFIKEGDYLLLLDAENNEEVFLGLVERTKSLSNANQKTIEQWEVLMRKLRMIYKPSEEALFIKSLELIGCNRSELTMKQWLRGTTMAPQDVEDMQKLFKLSGQSIQSDEVQKIAREIDKVRSFHRKLGRRLHQKMAETVEESGVKKRQSLLDTEIDEILDLTHTVKVDGVSDLISIPIEYKRLYALS